MRNTKLNPFLLTGMLVAGGVIGAVGTFVFVSDGDGNQTHTSESGSTDVPQFQDSNVSGNKSAVTVGGVSDESDASLLQIAELTSDFARSAALHQLLAPADMAKLNSLVEESADILQKETRNEMQRLIFQRIATIDPRHALKTSERFPVRRHIIRSIFLEWSQLSLDEAVEHAKTLQGSGQTAALTGILESRADLGDEVRLGIAKSLGHESMASQIIASAKLSDSMENPEKAWNELVGQELTGLENLSSLVQIANAWVEQDGIGVLGRISGSLKSRKVRTSVMNSVVLSAAKTNPQGTLDYVLSNQDQNSIWLSSLVAQTWARSAPEGAFSVVTDIENSRIRRRLQEGVIQEWATQSAYALLDHVNTLPENMQAYARQRAVLAIGGSDPEEAIGLLETLDLGEEGVGSVAHTIVHQWSEIDAMAAHDWVMSNPDVADMRGELLHVVLMSLVEDQPQLAMELALQQPVAMRLDSAVISQLARFDRHLALSMLSQVREGRGRLSAYTSVGRELVDNDETQRAIKLGESLDPSSRTAYYNSILRSWASSDPEGLFESLDSLPSPELKSIAAMSLAFNNHRSKILSEDQIAHAKTYLSEQDAQRLALTGNFTRVFSSGGGPTSIVVTGESIEPGSGLASDLAVDAIVNSLGKHLEESIGNALMEIQMNKIEGADVLVERRIDGVVEIPAEKKEDKEENTKEE